MVNCEPSKCRSKIKTHAADIRNPTYNRPSFLRDAEIIEDDGDSSLVEIVSDMGRVRLLYGGGHANLGRREPK